MSEVAPRSEYRARLEARSERIAELEAVESRLANTRLLLFVVLVVGAILLRGFGAVWVVVAVGVLAFVFMIALHDRTRRELERARRAAAFYETGLARLDYEFAGTAPTGVEWLDDAHPYSSHLDLFGDGSIYQFLCGSRTGAGRERLARWLLEPAPREEVLRRQEAIRELRGRLDLREDLATFETRAVDAIDAAGVIEWATGPAQLPGAPWPLLARLLPTLAVSAAVAAAWIGWGAFTIILLVQWAVASRIKKPVERVIHSVEHPQLSLRLARAVLVRLESESFESDRLTSILQSLTDDGPPPSERLGGLLKRVDYLEWRGNDMFAPVSAVLMWGTNWAYSIERWRLEQGDQIERWIRGVGELEAFSDLGRYAYERPEARFPELAEGEGQLEALELNHPLLAEGVPNDVSLSAERPLVIVTGSNMSGKSTLLRAIGVNVILAQCGAPVHAASMRLSELALGASIHTVDSLQDGASRFYAEVRSIKTAMDLASGDRTGLFLLDELLHGTNSHDRRIGAESIIGGFLDRGALGFVTTHDLALAAIADELGDRAQNAHFEFTLEDGELRFDYRLHPGVVRTGNALEIMRSVGLEI